MGPSTRRPFALALTFALGVALLGVVVGTGCKRRSRAGTGESTGVAACDDYAARYEACIERRGEEESQLAEPSFASQRSAFKLNAGTPDEQRALAKQCSAAAEAIAPLCGK